MAETWGEPQKMVVVALQRVMDGAAQKKDKYGPGLCWNVRYEGQTKGMFSWFVSEPAIGEQVDMMLCTSTSNNGKTYLSYWTCELYDKKKSGGSKGGGAKPNYSLEQEAYRDSRRDAIAAIHGGLTGKDGPLSMTLENIAKVTAKFTADLLAAGKKPE